MTAFNDTQLRSDEYAQRSRMFYDQQRYGADARAGQAIQQFGQQVPEIIMAQRAMDQRAVEVAHQHATQQGELQLGQQKLQFAMAIDGSEMSYEQVRAARTQNDMAEQALKEQKRRFESADKNELAELNAQAARALAAAGNYGYEYDPTMPPSQQFRKRSDAERQQAIDEAQEGRTRLGSGGNEDVDRKRILNEITDLEDLYYGAPKGSPEQARWKRAMERAQSRYHALSERSTAGGAPSQGNSGAPAPAAAPQPKPLADNERALVTQVRDRLRAAPADGIRIMAIRPHADSIADWIVRNRGRIQDLQQKGYDKDKSRKGLVATEDSAIDEVIQILTTQSDPRYDAFLQRLANEGAFNR